MMARTTCRLILSVTLFTAVLYSGAYSQPTPAALPLPASVQKSLSDLKWSFGLAAQLGSLGTSMIPHELERNVGSIRDVLDYAASSPRNQAALAGHLFSSVEGFAARFKPGTTVDDQFTESTYNRSQEPEYGISIQCYLLLEIAKQKGRSAFTKRVLTALYNARLASCYLGALRTLRKWPDDTEVVKHFDSFITSLGGEIAYYCDKFMAESHGVYLPPLLSAASPETNEYGQWRKDELTKAGPGLQQQKVMQYVKKLIATLPAR